MKRFQHGDTRKVQYANQQTNRKLKQYRHEFVHANDCVGREVRASEQAGTLALRWCRGGRALTKCCPRTSDVHQRWRHDGSPQYTNLRGAGAPAQTMCKRKDLGSNVVA